MASSEMCSSLKRPSERNIALCCSVIVKGSDPIVKNMIYSYSRDNNMGRCFSRSHWWLWIYTRKSKHTKCVPYDKIIICRSLPPWLFGTNTSGPWLWQISKVWDLCLKADTENEKSAKVSKNAFPTLMLSANACERIPRQKRTVARFTGMWYMLQY